MLNPFLVCREAVAKWGPEAQLRKLQEECGELVAAVNQTLIGRDDFELSNLAQEVADVEIMCAQARLILGDAIVDSAKLRKLERLQRILDGSEPQSHAGKPKPFQKTE